MKEYYEMTVAGVPCKLPICPLNDQLSIAGFVIFGQVELTVACARELLKLAPADYDVMLTAESKGIPLIHEMARQSGRNTYVLARKKPKLYMKKPIGVSVHSITTEGQQMLYLDEADMLALKGKKVLIVDDVISTGESLNALEELVRAAEGNIVGRLAILAEGDAKNREGLKYLEYLPLFNPDGTVKG